MRARDAVWSDAARSDLLAAHSYIAHDNALAADRFFLDPYRKVEATARAGLVGVGRAEFGDGVRSIAYRERVIFFRISQTELTVLRVLHGHQDISPEHFNTDKD